MLVYVMMLAMGAMFAVGLSYNFQEQTMDFPTAVNMMLLVLVTMVVLDIFPMGTLLIAAIGYILMIWGGPRE